VSRIVAERLTAQLLSGHRPREPVAVVERLLAVQAQDPRGARLAIRARTTDVAASAVDSALTDDRSLVVTWLNRGTLHLVRSEDYPWLHALTTPHLLTGNARRLAQLGVSPAQADRGVRVIERSLTDDGPLTRAQLGERVAAARVPSEGQALVHLLMLATLRGIAVRGPVAGGQHAYALTRDWLGEPATPDRERSLAELARRFLAGHGPADERDLAKWAGVRLRDARAGLDAAEGSLVLRDDGLVDLARRRPVAPLPAPRLLGSYDPVLHGWTSREPLLGANEPRVTIGGLFRPFALVEGRAAAVWALRDGAVVLEPFQRLPRRVAALLGADAEAVLRFLRE
jgi:hypothetical protein